MCLRAYTANVDGVGVGISVQAQKSMSVMRIRDAKINDGEGFGIVIGMENSCTEYDQRPPTE